ncbi:WD40 repeat domain-containing protein [Aspergillus melleus]|uniref:WD40 repeat domain-containing protein n=1 Tax=Aspergillus melleus TaxID=138277 RepID=UPI001E8DD767|nr:WD domain protein [Aspergillus melleus]KAH8427824.1 WD domain protein [Aspergillus melleus]
MDGYNHRSKRRRLDPSPVRPNGFIKSPTESSSDELAAGSEHDEAERRRASWSIQKAVPPKRPYRRSRSYSGSESPDELTMDAEDYWRSRGRGRKSPSEVSAEPSSEQYPDEGEGDGDAEDAEEEDEGVEAEEEDAGAEGDAEDVEIEDVEEIPADVEEPEAAAADDADAAPEQTYSDRSPTPVPPPPPPPPPKPDKLNYQQKFLLRGHLRGVSAVQFSPDASMIASGGADGAVKVWDTQSGRLIHTFEGHLAGVSTISWGPDGAIIASGSDDKTIRLWNVLTVRIHFCIRSLSYAALDDS